MHYTPTAIWRETGLKITCDRTDSDVGSHLLRFEDLNPETHIQNVVTRWQLARIALWLMWRAVWK